jgi:large subunit ribosomal protein L25
MTKIINLLGEERLGKGKGCARAVRRNHMIPSTIYGGGKEQVMLNLPEKEVTLAYLKGGFKTQLVDITVGTKQYKAIPKQIQLHPVTDKIIHLDFIHIGENDRIKVTVPVRVLNEDKCAGVKQGGLLNIVKHDVEIMCLATSIPEHIDIDIAKLEIGVSVHVSDIKLANNAEILTDEDVTILSIAARAAEKDDSQESAAK